MFVHHQVMQHTEFIQQLTTMHIFYSDEVPVSQRIPNKPNLIVNIIIVSKQQRVELVHKMIQTY